MSRFEAFGGSCQCGTIRFDCSARPFVAYTCHCLECQKLTASAFATCLQVPAEAVRVARGEPRRAERVADTGNRITTWFCSDCGSALYSQNAARPRIRTLYVGILDDPGAVEISAHIWTKRKQPWVELPSQHRVFSGAGDWREDYASDLSRLNL